MISREFPDDLPQGVLVYTEEETGNIVLLDGDDRCVFKYTPEQVSHLTYVLTMHAMTGASL